MSAERDYDDFPTPAFSVVPTVVPPVTHLAEEREKALPLPGWLVKLYFIFPVVLYIPDAIFNYYVYSDGAYVPNATPLIQASQIALWLFLSIGVVGMAYLLSVLAPWHWTNGHHLQALFCWVGVLIATGVTVWNSLSYRSSTFTAFQTDHWLYAQFPQLAAQRISVTMILVAIAPPFWGLFWALVQPTNHRRSLTALRENHQEKLMRVQHDAELKRLRAEANAKVREAQLKGMAQTAAAARAQAGQLFTRKSGEESALPTPPERHAISPQRAQVAQRVTQTPATLPQPPAPRRARAATSTPPLADASPVSNPLARGRLAAGVTPPNADVLDATNSALRTR